MNIDRMNTFIEQMKSIDEKSFDMSKYAHECGTVACLGGWCFLNNAPKDSISHFLDVRDNSIPHNFSEKWLDLSKDQSDALFCAWQHPSHLKNVSLESAITALEDTIKNNGDVSKIHDYWEKVIGVGYDNECDA